MTNNPEQTSSTRAESFRLMNLNDYEKSMLAGEFGYPRQQALQQQLEVGRFFDAADFVEISQVHLMADTESLGVTGVEYLEKLTGYSEQDRKVIAPTVTDPRGIDLCRFHRLKQEQAWATLEQRAIAAFESFGILMTNTCINYQIVQPPVFGEHIAFGDTGSVIYANSVCGARSNFEGGPAALCAAFTGRVPRYGYHLDRHRHATHWFDIGFQPADLADWGALGAVVGQRTGSYWNVPFLRGIQNTPSSDQLKHFGAALASYGSVPLFHMDGITPEAQNISTLPTDKDSSRPAETISSEDIISFYTQQGRYKGNREKKCCFHGAIDMEESSRAVCRFINQIRQI